jgi:hypothetical protein
MPRYYSHLENGDKITDLDGKELPSLEAALDDAHRVGKAHRDRMADGTHRWNVLITDTCGDFVAPVPCALD